MKVFFAKDNTIFDGLFYVNNEVLILRRSLGLRLLLDPEERNMGS